MLQTRVQPQHKDAGLTGLHWLVPAMANTWIRAKAAKKSLPPGPNRKKLKEVQKEVQLVQFLEFLDVTRPGSAPYPCEAGPVSTSDKAFCKRLYNTCPNLYQFEDLDFELLPLSML